MKLPIYQVDAFTKEQFRGNPAGVCILEKEIDDFYKQQIAEEMNLSETAFVSPADGETILTSRLFNLRWFTPKNEVPLCGHATLGTSKVLFDDIGISLDEIIFETKSGRLGCEKCKEGISLDFPIDQPTSADTPAELLEAMGISSCENIVYGKSTKKLVFHLKNKRDLMELNPDFELMKKISCPSIKGVGVTCMGDDGYDFISRYFNPWAGVNEDPVTGSVHTLLACYWGNLLRKKELKAYQASSRGGSMLLRIEPNDRIKLIGESVIVLKGTISIPSDKPIA